MMRMMLLHEFVGCEPSIMKAVDVVNGTAS